MSQQYSLKWNNHQPNFISMFTSLLSTQTLVDVTIAAEGHHLKAHKVVLAACSAYFQALFADNPSQHPIVILKDVTFADLQTIVHFMYYGEVNITEQQLPQVLSTARHLKIKGLTEMPESAVTRTQGSNASSLEFMSTEEGLRETSPALVPSKRRRRSMSSTGSPCVSGMGELEAEAHEAPRESEASQMQIVEERLRDERQDQMPQAAQSDVSGAGGTTPTVMAGGQWLMDPSGWRYNSCLGINGGGGNVEPEGGAVYMNNQAGHAASGEAGEYGLAWPAPAPPATPDVTKHELQGPPTKRRRTTNPQSEENFQRALEAVRFGGIGFCKAARMFGVNNRTLWLEYKKKGYPNNRPSIRSRIKREHTTPPREMKQEMQLPEQQMSLICPPHPVSVGFIESRPLDFPLQGVTHTAPLNLLNMNLNSMQ